MQKVSPATCLALIGSLLIAIWVNAAQALDVHATRSQGGTHIEYAAGGSGLPVLVFIHGWNCDRSYWDAQTSHFVTTHRVVAVDLAGHGASGTDREDYTMARFGQDVAASVPAEGPLVLVGHSMGGPVMLEAARLLGERVVGMVAVDSLTRVSPDVLDSATVDTRLAAMQADYDSTVRPIILSMFSENADPALREHIVTDMMAGDPRVATSATRGMMTMNFAATFAELNAPLVLINSARNPTDMEALRAMYADSSLLTMDGVGHFLMMEKPQVFNALLERAIASILKDS